MNNKRILITGATGAIGGEALNQLYQKQEPSSISVFIRPSKKAQKLVKKYPGINVFYGTITNEDDVAKACVNQDYVIHLAAIIPPVADDKPKMAWAVNVVGTQNIVKGMETHSPDGFLLYSSSVAIYGDRNKNPDITISDELKPSMGDDYGVTKVEAEKIIRESSLSWSIYRLSAIMGIGNHKISKLMFHMPLDTVMEIATVRDTARAFINSIGKRDELEGKTFNLGGGKNCRITYIDFMTRAFDLYGMGKVDFPKYSFAKINFHCGNYMDGDLLENIVHFRTDTIDTFFERFGAAVPGIQRFFTKLVNKPVKMYLAKLSEPLHAHKKQDKELLERFFGSEYDAA